MNIQRQGPSLLQVCDVNCTAIETVHKTFTMHDVYAELHRAYC